MLILFIVQKQFPNDRHDRAFYFYFICTSNRAYLLIQGQGGKERGGRMEGDLWWLLQGYQLLWILSTLITYVKTLIPKIVNWELTASIYEFVGVGEEYNQSIIDCLNNILTLILI